jgi:class 3 adenylate cyclase/tetratricopeptide (TPR) repeat protein
LNPPDFRFCGSCGERLGDAPVASDTLAPEGERKRITALFSDLTGYTAMNEQLDPEEVKEITARIFVQARRIIAEHDGFVERFAGDGVMALFGVPRAHEDDPVRAIHSALQIHEFVSSLSPQYGASVGRPLTMHTGINSGLVVTSQVDPERGTHSSTGDAINTAARLSGLAQAGEILVGEDTYRRARDHFSFEILKPTKVKGKSEPIGVYKVISPKDGVSRPESERRIYSAMVGRDDYLHQLETQVRKVINGQGSVINVLGEAGIGKSRLIAELKTSQFVQGVTFLEATSISIGKNLSFYPFIHLLRQWAGIGQDDSESQAYGKLEQATRAVNSEAAEGMVPFLATLMGLKLSEKDAARVVGIEGEALEKVLLKNVRELLIAISEVKPLVIVMEDLHFADSSSVKLMEALLRLVEKHPMVFINVFRPGYWEADNSKVETVGEWLPDRYVELSLQPLDIASCQKLIRNLLESEGLPHTVREHIVQRAGGNPLFIEEVIRSLIDQGAVVGKEGSFEVTDKIAGVVIPPTINDVLIARIDRLEERSRELVKVASVIGRSFFDRILKDVAKSIDQIDSRLAYLKNLQLIRDRVRHKELEYLFKHALAQEAAYNSTLLQKRRALHVKVAQAIERIFQERVHEFYGMLAYHYTRGQDLEKAEEYLLKAGEEALRSSASTEALNYYQEGLRLYRQTRGDDADPHQLAVFEKNIGTAFLNKGQFADALKYFDSALERWGIESAPNPAFAAVKLARDALTVLIDLYFPSKKEKKPLNEMDQEIFDLRYKRARALTYVAPKRLFGEAMAMLRQGLAFDAGSTGAGAKLWIDASGMFSYTGLSFKLSDKFLTRSKTAVRPERVSELIAYAAMEVVNHGLAGRWSSIGAFDKSLFELACKNGELWHALLYAGYHAVIAAERGEFDIWVVLSERIQDMADVYGYDEARIYLHQLKTDRLIKIRSAAEASTEADNGILFAGMKGPETNQILLFGYKAIAEILRDDAVAAAECMSELERFVRRQGFVPPVFMAPYLLCRFLTDIHLLNAALARGNGSEIREYRRKARKSGRAAVKNSKKLAPLRTWILTSMGTYHWLVDSPGKAFTWWDKAIEEGERLSARVDLSRAYFEVGRHLLKSDGKYRELNGVDAQGYLDKARRLFKEMGLKHDLDALDRMKWES